MLTRAAGRPGAAVIALALLCGCTSVTQSFPDHSPQQVWTALVAAARTPSYAGPDPETSWTVVTNEVWLDEPDARIEIFRRLSRSVPRPGAEPQSRQREWRFRILMDASDPPAATFVCRSGGVPMHARMEAERYFAEVDALLRVPDEYDMTTDLFDALGLDDSPEPPPMPETWPVDEEEEDEALEPLPPPPGRARRF